jgi:regulator of protease activity HflC (stomatin/prohibitin superfamily)
MTELLTFLVVVVALLAAVAGSAIRILREYERAVVFRLGRLIGQKGPGLVLLIPGIDRMVRVDLRTIVLDIPPQDLITRDNVPAKVNAVAYFRVVDAPSAVVEVERYIGATSQIAQTTLRSVLGKADLDMLLADRERLNESLQQIIDEQTDPWGIKVTTVEIKDVEIPSGMQRAMARQAEAERERRAKVIHAEGEFQASQRLRDAADVISPAPAALQLRYLQTLTEVGVNQNSTIIFPLPLDVIRPFLEGAGQSSAEASSQAPAAEPFNGREPLPDGAPPDREALPDGSSPGREALPDGSSPSREALPDGSSPNREAPPGVAGASHELESLPAETGAPDERESSAAPTGASNDRGSSPAASPAPAGLREPVTRSRRFARSDDDPQVGRG